jgi:hypothetical protein
MVAFNIFNNNASILIFKFVNYADEVIASIQLKFKEITNSQKPDNDLLTDKLSTTVLTLASENQDLDISKIANKANAATFDYFVHGHGVQAKESFKVPEDMIIKFYVKEGKLFDDAWMKTVRDQSEPPSHARFEDFECNEYKHEGAEECPNYFLMYPTGLCVDFPVDAQTEIREEIIVEPTKNNLMLSLGKVGLIKKPTNETYKLDWIAKELRKNHEGTLILHWCACREETDMPLDEWTEIQLEKGSLRKRMV